MLLIAATARLLKQILQHFSAYALEKYVERQDCATCKSSSTLYSVGDWFEMDCKCDRGLVLEIDIIHSR
jgi:hypothetical protein